jgi:hypothetical protein
MAATSTRTQRSCVTNCVHEQLIVSILQQLSSFISKISNRCYVYHYFSKLLN